MFYPSVRFDDVTNARRLRKKGEAFRIENEVNNEVSNRMATSTIDFLKHSSTAVKLRRKVKCSDSCRRCQNAFELKLSMLTRNTVQEEEEEDEDEEQSTCWAEVVDWQVFRTPPHSTRDPRLRMFNARKPLTCMSRNLLLDTFRPKGVISYTFRPKGVISYNPFQFLNVGYQGLDGFSTFRSYPNGFAAVLTVMCGAVEIVTLHREDAANVAGYMDLDLETLPSAIVTSTYETDKERREEMMREYRAVTPTLSMIRRVSKRVFRVGETLVMPSGTFFAYRYVCVCVCVCHNSR